MRISIIAAASENNVIGKDNQLIWHLPNDLKYFKQQTLHHTVIMGRKTYASMGKPLKDRQNIVLTKNPDFKAEGCLVVYSLEQAIDQIKNDSEPFIIGGGELYRQAIQNLADRIYLTRIHHTFAGDSFFPAIDPDHWREVERIDYPSDEKHAYPFSFITFDRKR